MVHRRATFAVAVCVALAGGGVPRAHVCESSGNAVTVRVLPDVEERRKRRDTNPPHRAPFLDALKNTKETAQTGDSDFGGGRRQDGDVSAVVASHWLTPQDIAADLEVTPQAVRGWINRGLLKARGRTPGRYRVHRDDYTAFLQELEANRQNPWKRQR